MYGYGIPTLRKKVKICYRNVETIGRRSHSQVWQLTHRDDSSGIVVDEVETLADLASTHSQKESPIRAVIGSDIIFSVKYCTK